MSGAVEVLIPSGGITRIAYIRQPNGLRHSVKLPLFVLCHGGGSTGQQMEVQAGMDQIADDLGFLVAYPNGSAVPASGQGYIWNTPPCFSTPYNDVQYVARDLPVWMSQYYGADLSRVYVGGFSEGGILGWKCYREASDVVAGLFSHSGDIGVGQTTPTPAFARPFLYIQGLTDTVCPPAGGIGPDSPTNCNHASMALGQTTAEGWCGCTLTSTDSEPGYTDYLYSTGGSVPFRFITVTYEGHNWTGGVPIINPPNQASSNVFSASQLIAQWMQPFHL